MSKHQYTEEEKKWVENNKELGTAELVRKFNEHFNVNFSYSQLNNFRRRRRLLSKNIHHYSKEEKQWLFENYKGKTNKEIRQAFYKKFSREISEGAVRGFKFNYGLRSGVKRKPAISPLEGEWVRKNSKGISTKKLVEKFNKEFNKNITICQMSYYKKNNNIKGKTIFRFNKQQNEWLKYNIENVAPDIITYEDVRNKFNKKFEVNITQIQFNKWRSRNQVSNDLLLQGRRKLGEEYRRMNGEILIKTANPNVWETKRDYIWKQHFGEIPEGFAVIFLDGNKENFELDNLYLIEHQIYRYACRNNLISNDKELTKTGLLTAELIFKKNKKEREVKGETQ